MFNYPQIDPVAISLGPINIHWYAISYLLGFFVCWRVLLSLRDRQRQSWRREQISDLLSYGVFGVILGGRFGYVLFYGFDNFLQDPISLLKIWQGGMSFHGGLLGVIAAVACYAHRNQRTFLEVMDFVAPGVPLALGLGRIGNFINAELPGRITDVPWSLIYPGEMVGRHPSSLYQMTLEGPVLFAIVYALALRHQRVGMVSGGFLIAYSGLRFFSEFFRLPDSHLGFVAWGWATQGQLLCIPMLLLGIGVVIYAKPAIPPTALEGSAKGRSQKNAQKNAQKKRKS